MKNISEAFINLICSFQQTNTLFKKKIVFVNII